MPYLSPSDSSFNFFSSVGLKSSSKGRVVLKSFELLLFFFLAGAVVETVVDALSAFMKPDESEIPPIK